jgi:outer membrane murein-binding lipoprotein Lpp
MPAYDVSQLLSLNEKKSWNKAINQCIKKSNTIDKNNKEIKNKEDDKMAENLFFKSLNELSHGDVRSQIMEALSKTMTADEFSYVWVSSYAVYDTYFVYENYEGGKYVNYKVPYTKSETQVVVDLANKVLVERDSIWVEVGQFEEVQTSLNAKTEELKVATAKVEELQTSLNTANETIKTLESEKEGVVEKFNGASETVVSLNSKVEELTSKVSEMKPLIDKYNQEQYEKALNSAKEEYKAKFEKVGALDVFEKDETLELIKKSINSKEEKVSRDAIFELNQLIVDNVRSIKVDEVEDVPTAKSVNSIVAGKVNKNLDKDFVNVFEENCGFSFDEE